MIDADKILAIRDLFEQKADGLRKIVRDEMSPENQRIAGAAQVWDLAAADLTILLSKEGYFRDRPMTDGQKGTVSTWGMSDPQELIRKHRDMPYGPPIVDIHFQMELNNDAQRYFGIPIAETCTHCEQVGPELKTIQVGEGATIEYRKVCDSCMAAYLDVTWKKWPAFWPADDVPGICSECKDQKSVRFMSTQHICRECWNAVVDHQEKKRKDKNV